MLLVWLVVPAEAAGAAQAAGGVAAVVAAAAAGASTVLNYWAAMEDETTGDLKVLTKGKGIMRIMTTNLRRVKREQGDGNEMSERVWNDTLHWWMLGLMSGQHRTQVWRMEGHQGRQHCGVQASCSRR